MKRLSIGLTALSLCTAGIAHAQETDAILKARQGQFRLIALNTGTLGDMASGKVEYDADAAQLAADSLVGISSIHQAPLWPEGTSMEDISGTKALPAIMEDMNGFSTRWENFGNAAASMRQVAGEGLDAMRPAMAELGGACKACHDDYRD
ncbi:cytochrome c' [Salipiger pallidus]|uniref:Cytochrome c n=1 Tax=Salipiger pallidus TaxID=1775170 RepID=A0A8J3EGJ7_9RHOB|nr:cytochrome c [Salipiger pallidus]GGG76917.1 cytochrome c' [Salipiger pallidus]